MKLHKSTYVWDSEEKEEISKKLAARNMKLDILKMSKSQKVRRTFSKKVDFWI